MTPQEKERAIAITKDIKTGIRGLLNKHASEISRIRSDSPDPHTPIIGVLQMALAQAATEYLLTCGCQPNEAVQLSIDHMGTSVQHWLNSITGPKESK